MAKNIRIETCLRRLSSLQRQASAMKSRTGQVEVEGLLTKALGEIETIKKTGKNHKREADAAIIRAFGIYQSLQRLSDDPDYFVGTNRNNPHRVVSAQSDRDPVLDRANYSSVRWDAAAMMAVPKDHAEWNPYWRPPPQPAPCYTYTQQQLDQMDPTRKKQ